MAVKHRLPAVVLSILVASPAASPAGDCTPVIDQIGSDAQQFQSDAQKMGIDFARDEALGPALDGARKSLEEGLPKAGGPGELTSELKKSKAQLEKWRKRVHDWNSQLHDLKGCFDDVAHCNLQDALEHVNADLRDWIKSLGDPGLASSAERVGKASDLLQGYSSRLEGAALGSASAAVSCMNERVAQQSGGNDAVDLSKEKQQPPVKAGGPGGSPGSGGGTAAAGATHGHPGALVAALIVVPLGVAGALALGKAAANAANASSCVTASALVAAAAGVLAQYGPSIACTRFIPCSPRSNMAMAVCVDLSCDTARYYYSTSDGSQFHCTTVAVGTSFRFDSSYCNGAAAGVVNYCAAH